MHVSSTATTPTALAPGPPKGAGATRWARACLVLLMVLDVWYRAHTFGPDIRAATGIDLWPQTIGESEPLDCDEAAYAYMGHRVLRGDALYRDLTEYKPPLGYWIYTMAVAIGGYRELAIRLMAIPFVLVTIAAVWWVAMRIGGPLAACLAAGLYVVLSTDPFLFGNGSQLEQFMNFFSVLALAMVIRGWDRGGRRWIFAAGVCLARPRSSNRSRWRTRSSSCPRCSCGPGRMTWGLRDAASGGSSTSWCSALRCRPSWRSQRRSSWPGGPGERPTRTSSSRRWPWRRTRCPSRTPHRRRSAGSRATPILRGSCPGRSARPTTVSGGGPGAGRSGWRRYRRWPTWPSAPGAMRGAA